VFLEVPAEKPELILLIQADMQLCACFLLFQVTMFENVLRQCEQYQGNDLRAFQVSFRMEIDV
jgi:hypothetical protein